MVLAYEEREAKELAHLAYRGDKNYRGLWDLAVGLPAARRETTRRASDAARRRKRGPIEKRGLLEPRGESVETTPQTSENTDCP